MSQICIIPEDEEEKTILEVTLDDLVDDLPAQTKTILKMVMAGYTQKEIASFLGMSRSSVGNISRRAIRELKKRMCEH